MQKNVGMGGGRLGCMTRVSTRSSEKKGGSGMNTSEEQIMLDVIDVLRLGTVTSLWKFFYP